MKSLKNKDSFGKRLRNSRLDKGLSQSELAVIMETSNKMISRYERDDVKPSITVAADLAKVLGTSIGYLLGDLRFPADPELESLLRDILAVPESEQTKIKDVIVTMLKSSKKVLAER